ncbi:MAG TPA: CBS domain-containing protein [Actinomycetota bacterium]|nr:CBS domain-containing protein [Actinomycetota bacterium]
MKVREIYTPGLATIRPTDTLVQAAQTMVLGSLGALLVEGENTVEGIVTEADLVGAIALDIDVRSAPISDHLSPSLETIDLDDDARNAANRMRLGHFRHLVVTQDGRMIGVVSMRDIAALVGDDVSPEP